MYLFANEECQTGEGGYIFKDTVCETPGCSVKSSTVRTQICN